MNQYLAEYPRRLPLERPRACRPQDPLW